MPGARYGGRRDEGPGGDVEWDVGGGEEDLEEFGISRVVYDRRLLNAAAGAVMRRHTWREYGANI